MTESESASAETPSEVAAALEKLTSQRRAALAAGGGEFGARALEAIEASRGIVEREGGGPHERDSEGDFASQILRMFALAQHRISEGRADEAARFAYEAGSLWATAVMKFSWESDVLKSRRRTEDLAEGSARSNRKRSSAARRKHIEWASVASEVERSNPGLSQSRIAEIVKRKLGLSEQPDTIVRGIKKVRKAG